MPEERRDAEGEFLFTLNVLEQRACVFVYRVNSLCAFFVVVVVSLFVFSLIVFEILLFSPIVACYFYQHHHRHDAHCCRRCFRMRREEECEKNTLPKFVDRWMGGWMTHKQIVDDSRDEN